MTSVEARQGMAQVIRSVSVFCGSSDRVDRKYFAAAGIDEGFIKPEFLDLWYPAPDIDAVLRYLDGYEPHGYGLTWTRRTRKK